MCAYKCCMQTKFGDARSREQNFTDKSGQKVDNFEPIYLGNYLYWWKMICDFWAHYQLAFFFGYVHLPQLEYYFFFFFLTFFPFYYFSPSTFKPLNALYSKFEQLKISGRTSARLKLRVPGLGNPPQTGPPKFWTFKLSELDESNFRNG